MALALVAESAVSAVIEKLISVAVSYVGSCVAGPSDVQEEIRRLQQSLPRIQAILTFVEEGQTVDTKQDGGLDAWLWQLRDAVDQAEDVLDEMEYNELAKAAQAGDNEVQQGTAPNSKRKANSFWGNDTIKRLRGDASKMWKGPGKASDNVAASPETLLQQRLREAVKALDNVAASSETLLQIASQLYNSDVKRQQEDEIRNARETSSLLTEDTIFYGRDTEKESIVEWLTKPTSDEPENASATVGKVSAFAIVGMGGLGKTTLAQFIYHDKKVREFFGLVMWVCVSDQFDVKMLTRKILEAAGVRDSLGDKSLNILQEILKEKLISKKFLLVLDDVWTDNKILEWDKLVAPLKFGGKGSKILLTTRMDSVADTVASVLQCEKEFLKLSGLKEVDFMHLFNKHAFGRANSDDHGNLKLIGEQIAKRLGGCPLAAKILGGCLNSCMDEKYWRRILNENLLDLEESEDNINMILRLSYHHLPTSLQICFRYCSIFPKDYEFEKNELIYMWVGSGLIKKPTHGRRSLDDIGEEYLNHLARKSLFDVQIIGAGSYREQRYVMHDLLHNLAQRVSSGECLGIESNGSRDIPKTIRHIYVDSVNPLMISHLKNLRTLIVRFNENINEVVFKEVENINEVVFKEVLKELKSLRLLRVTGRNSKFPDEVGDLIHLRYLSLSSWGIATSLLPQSVCRLHHLEVLELSKKTDIDDSTLDGMSNLVKLRRLHIPSDIMDKIPWIGKLTSLQELDHFRVREECGYKIDQLRNLQNLRKLGIRGLENVRSSEEAADANLIEKENLDKLSLVWYTNRSGGLEVEEPVLDNLRPHTNLKELEIEGYAGVRSPNWMTMTYLSNITSIHLFKCGRWEDLSPFGQLPSLKFLILHSMHAAKKLWCSRSVGGYAFRSLRELELHNMPDLESLEGEHMFPLLNKLVITSCPSLKDLPALPLTLNRLVIVGVGLTSLPMMQQDCSSGEGGASCSSSHPALSELSIIECPNLTSLDGFMSQQQCFPALASLCIYDCENMRRLPEKFFQKLPSLKSLRMELNGKELSSLDGLQALPSLESLFIRGCDKLIELSPLQPPSYLTSTSHTGMVLRPPMELHKLDIDRQALLRFEPLRSLNSVSALSISGDTELTSLDEQWLLRNRDSLQRLVIFKASSLQSLPTSMIDLQALLQLHIYEAPLLRTIPELSASMTSLVIFGCRPELKEYIEGSGKFANIGCVSVTEKSS